LGKVSESIHQFGLHKDIQSATELYKLSKTNDLIFDNHQMNTDIHNYPNKKQGDNEEEIVLVTQYFEELISDLVKDRTCIYPDIKTYSYPKRKTIRLLRLSSVPESKRFRLSIDKVMDELDKTDLLLRYSKSGEDYFGVTLDQEDELSEEKFRLDRDSWEKDVGKILKHKFENDRCYLLIKWKYLALENSTWVKAKKYKENQIIRAYLLANDLLE